MLAWKARIGTSTVRDGAVVSVIQGIGAGLLLVRYLEEDRRNGVRPVATWRPQVAHPAVDRLPAR